MGWVQSLNPHPDIDIFHLNIKCYNQFLDLGNNDMFSIGIKSICINFILLSFLFGCASTSHYKLTTEWIGFQETGTASYYGNRYHFRKTASGERFNQYALTAAHKRLPFGSKVRVTNLSNGKSIVVVINDRGPFIRGRIIDLSKTAFNRIGDLKSGLITVKIKVIK